MKFKLFATTAITSIIFPSISVAFFCPTNFNQIDFGMTVDQVIQACGKPVDIKESVKQNDNVPQEWSYYIPQTVNMGGSSQNAQGTLKTNVTFDSKGKAINISVNGIGVGATMICGQNIQLGDDKDRIKSVCGDPSFVNKSSPSPANPEAQQETKIVELIYSNGNPPTTLVFENGSLKDKK